MVLSAPPNSTEKDHTKQGAATVKVKRNKAEVARQAVTSQESVAIDYSFKINFRDLVLNQISGGVIRASPEARSDFLQEQLRTFRYVHQVQKKTTALDDRRT